MTDTLTKPVPPVAERQPSGYMHGLDLLRILASVGLVLTHLTAWFALRDKDYWLALWVQRDVVGTLHLNSHLSLLGVALSFVLSGVVVTHVASRERPLQFLWRRVVRLMPLLWVVTLLAWTLINLGYQVSAAKESDLTFGALVSGMFLVNFFMDPPVALVAVTWTLTIQIVFYAYVAATIPLLRRKPWIPPLAAVPLCFITLLVTDGFSGSTAFQIGQFGAYLPVLVIGQLISLVHSGKVHPLAGTAIGAAHFVLFIWVHKATGYTLQGDSMPRTVFIAVLLTIVLVSASGPVSRSAFVRGWSKRTYAIYLVHLSCLYPLFDTLMGVLDPNLVVVLGLALTALVAEILHRLVEMPAHNAVRRWEKRTKR
ncbi:acyltransferase family protein [Lentzea sp. NPDC058450]|uniref:acyltransferase family protein n=1 Tax=Lentzea sp. NPDC058450 TaxID=3346505 RepID=UPI0036485866